MDSANVCLHTVRNDMGEPYACGETLLGSPDGDIEGDFVQYNFQCGAGHTSVHYTRIQEADV